MRVSVVIPTYNCGPLVAEAVASVLAQTRPADEVVVVDDGSTDDTGDRVAAFGPPVRYVRKENGGVATARNRGIAEAAGDLIAFLDADDVWHPRKLEVQLAAFAARPALGMLGTGVYDWPAAAHPPAEVAPPGDPVAVPLAELVVRNPFTTSTVVVRREVLLSVGEFDTDQFGTEDHDLWLRIAQRAPVANLAAKLAGYRAATPGSLSKNAARMEAGMRIILRKLDESGVFHGRPLLRRKAWAYFRYAAGYMHHRAGGRRAAAGHLTLSLLGYPFAYDRGCVRFPFGRVRLLAAALLRRGGAV
ncbi:MAG TPA: glycosyltransferase family A protein [Gemmataceae bacterium]|nr:glycosyltransferase family A protein [Gemmataceae bacterium]